MKILVVWKVRQFSIAPVLAMSLVGFAAVMSHGCLLTEPNLNYCSNVNGDSFCAGRHDGERPFCVLGSNACFVDLPDERRGDNSFDGCVEEEPASECHSLCGGGQSQTEQGTCVTAADGTGAGGEESTSSGSSSEGSTASEVTADGTSTGDSSSTGSGIECGNGVLEEGEDCDGTDLNGKSCESLGANEGVLGCNEDCTLDEDECAIWTCDNGIREGLELCDGNDLAGQSCTTLGYTDGVLACNANCMGFDVAGCTNCGNGAQERGEMCDGAELGGTTCESLTGLGGTLACDVDCAGFDSSGCTCGNNNTEGAEVCDGTDLNGQDCMSQGLFGGDLACDAGCMAFDTSSCTNCGNGTQEDTEECDDMDLNLQICATVIADTTGPLSCNIDCTFDVSQCCLGKGFTCNVNADCCSMNCNAMMECQ